MSPKRQGDYSMKRAAIYARYSCDKQRDESIDDQVAACREYASAHDMEVVDVYADAAMSGRDDDRPQFQAMLSAEGFEVLLVWKLDRFARDRFDASVNRRHLKKRGVQVVSVTEPISDGPEGIIMEGLLFLDTFAGSKLVAAYPRLNSIVTWFSMQRRFIFFSEGMFRLEDLVFFLTLTAVVLCWNIISIEKRRWSHS